MQEKSHKWIYIVIIVAIVALMVAGALMYHDQKQSKAAQAKAREFIASLNAAGLKAPSEATAVRLFGVDGGPYAKSLGEELQHAQYAWQLGTGGPASRPVILDEDFLTAADAFVRVYVTDKTAASQFLEWLNRLKTGETQ
jgi:hypothetical protein